MPLDERLTRKRDLVRRGSILELSEMVAEPALTESTYRSTRDLWSCWRWESAATGLPCDCGRVAKTVGRSCTPDVHWMGRVSRAMQAHNLNPREHVRGRDVWPEISYSTTLIHVFAKTRLPDRGFTPSPQTVRHHGVRRHPIFFACRPYLV